MNKNAWPFDAHQTVVIVLMVLLFIAGVTAGQ